MTRAQRGASKNASNAVKQGAQTDALKKPVLRRNAKVNKENVPTPKLKNSRKGSLQPLQEKNAVIKAEKSNKPTTSAGTAKAYGLSSNITKRAKTAKVHDNVKRIRLDENIVDAQLSEMPLSKNSNRRGESAAREQPDLLAPTNKPSSSVENVSVSPIRPTRRTQKTAIPTNPAAVASTKNGSNVPDISVFASPKTTRPQRRKQEKDIGTPTKPTVVPSTKNESKVPDISSFASPKTTRPRRGKQEKDIGTPTKPTVVPSTKNEPKLPDISSFASPKTTRPRRGKQEKDIGTPTKPDVSSTKTEIKVSDISAFTSPKTTQRGNQQKNTNPTTAFISTVRNARKKSLATRTPTKAIVVPSTKIESTVTEISAFASPKTTRGNQQKTKPTPTPKPLSTSNVTVRRKGGKKPDLEIKATSDDKNVQGNTQINQFVTTRKRGRNMEPMKTVASETSQSKPVISKVTRRRKENAAISSTVSKEKEMDDVTVGVTRRRRLQSVSATRQEDANVRQIDTLATPVRNKNGTKNRVEKVDKKVSKQLELSVNCNVAGDVSDQSNGSTVPVYKRTSSSNNNTVIGVFDFESNSQENTLNKDEQMQEVLAKLVRENKASVIKPKKKATKGVTKSKTTVARSKKTIEKIRSELKDLNQLKELSSRVITPKITASKTILKQQQKTSYNVGVVDLGVEDIDMAITSDDDMGIPSGDDMAIPPGDDIGISSDNDKRNLSGNDMGIPSGKSQRDAKETDNQQTSRQHVLPDISTKTDVNKERSTLRKISSPQTADTSGHTPTKRQTVPKKINTIFQSTPVQTARPEQVSPWRVPTFPELKHSNDFFSRYTAFAKSPIKSSENSKIQPRQETNQPIKKVHRQTLITKEVTDNLQKIEKPKDLTRDIENCFGFDNDDTDDNFPTIATLPGVNTSIGVTKQKSPKPKSGWFKVPQAIFNIKQKLAKLKTGQPSAAQTSDVRNMEREKTQSKIPTHFGGTRNVTVRTSTSSIQKDGSIKTAIKKKKIETTTRTQEVSGIENISTYTDVPTLFNTSWPEQADHKHRSYTRVPKREYKRPYENTNIVTDDESEFGESVTHVRNKRTKPKDDKLQEELRKFEEKYNSDFLEVDNYEMIMEKST